MIPFDSHCCGAGAVSHERLTTILEAALSQTPDHCAVALMVVPYGGGEIAGASYASTGDRATSIRMLHTLTEQLEETEPEISGEAPEDA